MQGTWMVLLALTLGTFGELAMALRCYTCRDPVSASNCVTITSCHINETMCKTTLYSLEIGEAFRCYTCEQPTAINSCKNIAQCKLEDTACKTVLETVEAEFPFNHSPMVTRSCSSSCLATDPDGIGIAHPVFCCFRDLCNSGFPGLVTDL